MLWLVSGLGLFTLVHLAQASLPSARAELKRRFGTAYRGAFAALSLAGIVMVVIGWRSTPPEIVYLPPIWGPKVSLVLMVGAIFLFGAAHGKSRVKRLIRHPQLTAIVVWAGAHLLSNGELRSIVLFSTLGVWAIAEIVLLNRRDGAWEKPLIPSGRSEIITAAISVAVFLVLLSLHRFYAGVSPIPG